MFFYPKLKHCNILDNLFVVYAIQNEAMKKKICVDLHFMDLSKCFDIMWSQETLNGLYDNGVQDDKFVLLTRMNEKCKVSVKTPVGVTDEFVLENIEMQGTVPAPLKCVAQMDGLGKICYTKRKYLYNYNNSCFVPSLGMVDDTFMASKCGIQSVQMNALVNTFIEAKKLSFNTTKCYVMHLGPRSEECAQLKVHNQTMKTTQCEKYLGDVISVRGNIDNIENRRKIGNQTISDALSILKEMGQGSFYVKTGLVFREASLKCKLLLNSEVWYCLNLKQIEMLEDIDKKFLRCILNAHSKVAIECLYFETGVLPLRYEIKIKRLMYLWKILQTNQEELIYRVFLSQSNHSHQGDWVRLVENDRDIIGLDLKNEEIATLSKNRFKNIVKKKVMNLALSELNLLKRKHSKSGYLSSNTLKIAPYHTNLQEKNPKSCSV